MSDYNGKLIEEKRDPVHYSSTVFAEQGGLSAYEIAVQEGFSGTEAEWLESLKGEPGEGLEIKGRDTYANIVALPAPEVGDLWIQNDTGGGGSIGDGLLWDENETWVNVGPIQGAIPPGGTVGQSIFKIDNTDGNVEWLDGTASISYGTDVNFARPASAGFAIWYGEGQPLNALATDLVVRLDEPV